MGALVHVQVEPGTWLPGIVVIDRAVITVVCARGFVHLTDRERLRPRT